MMDHHVSDFHQRLAQRNARKAATNAPEKSRGWLQRLDLRDDLEVYFLVFGVFYGGAATLFALYCGPGSAAADFLIDQGDLEFAAIRQFGGYWLYIFWPAVVASITFGMATKGPMADAMKALGLGAIIITVTVRGFVYLFGG